MTDQELEQRLAGAVNRTTPDDWNAILSRCGAQNGSVMEMKALKQNQNMIDVQTVEVKSKWRLRPWLAAACAALVLLGAGGGGLLYHQSYAVASVVSLDVNPSIELKVNRAERVISCTALNTEAAAVLFDMNGGADLKGTKLDVAVNAIVGALVREGYLDSISSAILISVEDNDQDRAARLQQELVASVDGVLRTQAPNTSVLSQVLTMDVPAPDNTSSGLSAGKTALVQKVMQMNGTIAADSTAAFDKLAALSVEELNDLLETGETRIPIGKPAAAMAAETYAGTAALNSVTTDVDPELDELPPHYEVEVKTAWGEFDYIVDAFTGEVLSGPKDILNQTSAGPAEPDPVPSTPNGTPQTPTVQPPAGTTAPSNQDAGQDAAKQAALNHAGLSGSDVTNWKVERDWEDGRLEYEIEFWCGSTEYDYTIDGYSCAILKHEQDHHPEYNSGHHVGNNVGSSSGNAASDIGQAAAKAAALNHAGVAENQTTKMEVDRDWENGRLEYEVDFKAGGMEYEYTIDGATGAVLEYESEWDD